LWRTVQRVVVGELGIDEGLSMMTDQIKRIVSSH